MVEGHRIDELGDLYFLINFDNQASMHHTADLLNSPVMLRDWLDDNPEAKLIYQGMKFPRKCLLPLNLPKNACAAEKLEEKRLKEVDANDDVASVPTTQLLPNSSTTAFRSSQR